MHALSRRARRLQDGRAAQAVPITATHLPDRRRWRSPACRGFSGFFSKDMILEAAFTSGHALDLAARPDRRRHDRLLRLPRLLPRLRPARAASIRDKAHHLHESPAAMTVPLDRARGAVDRRRLGRAAATASSGATLRPLPGAVAGGAAGTPRRTIRRRGTLVFLIGSRHRRRRWPASAPRTALYGQPSGAAAERVAARAPRRLPRAVEQVLRRRALRRADHPPVRRACRASSGRWSTRRSSTAP